MAIPNQFVAKLKWGAAGGSGLKELRINKRWTQEQLAEKIGVSRQTICQWETGTNYQEFPYDRVFLLCHALDISVEDFLKTCLKYDK